MTALTMLLCLVAGAPTSSGDALFDSMDYRGSVAAYDSALAAGADSSSLLWRIARSYVCQGDITPGEESLSCYRRAERAARFCIGVDSLRSEGYTWLAAALGNIAMSEGARTKVRMCHEIRDALEKAVRLNPADDIAYSILGSFYVALGSVSWFERQLALVFLGGLPHGGFAEAEQALQAAINLAPTVIRHRYELGRLYKLQGREGDALKEFREVTRLPVRLGLDRTIQEWASKEIPALENEASRR
jgi:tetratricopeptide (TPR) repeat protein